MKRAPTNVLTGTVTAISEPRPQTTRTSGVIPRMAKVVVKVDVGHGLSMIASINVGPPRRVLKVGDRVELEIPASSVIVHDTSTEADDTEHRKPRSREEEVEVRRHVESLKRLLGDDEKS